MQKLLKIVFTLAAVFGWLYFYFPTLKIIYKDKIFSQQICSSPVTYSIGFIDSRLKMTKEELSSALSDGVAIWESARNTDLFEETEKNGTITIIFKFDERQKVTNALGGLNGTIETQSNQVNLQKLNYNVLLDQYSAAKSDYEYSLKSFNDAKNSTDATNNQLRQELMSKQTKLEELRGQLNTYAGGLNEQVSVLNDKINAFNNLGQQRGESFNEGEYVEDMGTRTIYVYEFEDKDKLVRLLAHEFGHALGLEHVSGSKSIMNEINGSDNIKPSEQDIAELNIACDSKK